MRNVFVAATLILFSFVTLPAERTGYPPEEFTARRKALASALGQGTVVLFGKTMPAVSVRFRQDNDFYYFTGNEDLNAVFVMDSATAASWLFLPAQSAGEIRSDGKNWLTSGEAQGARLRGYPAAHRAERVPGAPPRVGQRSADAWTRLSEADEVDGGRRDSSIDLARRYNNPLGAQPSEDGWRADTLRTRYPFYRPEGRHACR